MATKLILLKSGEDIVSDIEEMLDGYNTVGYYLNKPCIVKLVEKYEKNSEKSNFNITMIPWMILSKDTRIPVPLDWVVTIVEPIDDVKNMYNNEVVNNVN
jgi:hypothetical protein